MPITKAPRVALSRGKSVLCPALKRNRPVLVCIRTKLAIVARSRPVQYSHQVGWHPYAQAEVWKESLAAGPEEGRSSG